MALVRPRPEDVKTLICEACQWVEPKTSLVIEMWSRDMGRDYCDICTPRRAIEAQAKRGRKKAA